MAASLRIPTTFTAVDKFSSVMRTMGKSVTGFSKKTGAAIQRFDQKISRSFKNLTRKVGVFGLTLGAAGLIGVVGGAVKIMADFEQSNANLAAILGKTVDQTKALQIDAKRLGATTAFTASQVAGLQTEFAKLGFAEEQILAATQSTLALAAATSTELPQAAKQVGATIRAFGLDASEASRVADVLALSTSKAALDMEFFATAMSKVAPISSKINFSLEDTSALFASLADAGFDASTAATSTKNILLKAADANSKLAKAIGRPARSMDDLLMGFEKLTKSGVDLTKMLNLTDARSVAAFATFLQGSAKIRQFSKEVNNAAGAAQQMADKQLNTLTGRLTILRSAYEGFILSMDDGTGAFSSQLKTIIEVATEVLSLASGTAAATDTLTEQQQVIRGYAETALRVAKIIKILTIAFIAYKAIVIVVTAVTKIWSAVQIAFNIIMAANPVVIIILAIIAAIATIVLVVKNWGNITKWFGNLWNRFTGFISGAWKRVVGFFKEFDFKAFFMRIGQSILQFLLFPMKGVLFLLSKIPGRIGKLAKSGLEKIGQLTGDVRVQAEPGERPQAEPPGVVSARVTRETVRQNNIAIDIRDKGDNVENAKSSGDIDIPINITKTQAAF